MKPGDLVQLFSRDGSSVWCWDEDNNDFYLPGGTSAIIIRCGVTPAALRDHHRHAHDLVLCDGKAVWVHRDQLEVINEAR